MAGHTKGPWVIRRDIDGLTILGGPNNEAIWCIAGYLPGGTGEMEANARLIASAPELLEALNEMVRIAVVGKRFDDSLLSDEGQAVFNAQTAIAKATQP